MRVLRFLPGLLVGAAALAHAADRRPLVPEDLHRLRELASPAASADGRWIAYAVSTPDAAANRNVSTIWLRSWNGAQAREIAMPGGRNAWQPAFVADGSILAFLSDAGESRVPQVWLAPVAGGPAMAVTALPRGVQEFSFAPDGQRVVVSSDVPGPDDGDDRAPIVVERLLFKEDDRGYLTGQRRHLFVVDLATGQAVQLTHGGFDAFLPAWSPDGARIAFVAKQAEEQGHPLGFDVYCVAADGSGSGRRISIPGRINNDPDHLSRPAWSPDGRLLAYLQGGAERWLEYAPWELVVADLATGSVRRLGKADRDYTHPLFSSDGGAVYALVEESRNTYLARIALQGNVTANLTHGNRLDVDLALGPDGRVALLSGDDAHPYRMSVVDAQGETFLPGHNDWLEDVVLQPVEDLSYRSTDGTRIDGFLVRPAGPPARHPTLLRLHGGPQFQFSHEFMFDWQLYAARGYAVVAPNPRGSSGRGFEFSRAIYAHWGTVDVHDALAGVDRAIALGVADPARLGVGGWSYGALLTNFTIASTRRFKAAIAGAGSANALGMYGVDEYTGFLEAELGTPWKNLETYLRVSYPFFHADRIRTPTLFLCGQADFNVPCAGSEQMYQALRSNRVPARLVVYPGMHHEPDTPANALDRLLRSLQWYDRYLLTPQAPALREVAP